MPFFEKEVKEVVWECDGNTIPGLDGFNFTFIKDFWNILKDDICCAIRKFHANGKILRGVSASFIALILNVDNLQNLGQYRPSPSLLKSWQGG